MKILVVTNIPVPYRIPIYNILTTYEDVELMVAYMAPIEENRKWTLPEFKHEHYFLPRARTFAKKDGFNYIHLNKGVWRFLNSHKPDVVITTGFNPAHIESWLWTRAKRKKHISMTDGWLKSEESLSFVHKSIRRIIFRGTEAYIGASKESKRLFEHYGAQKEKIFQSGLVINNDLFTSSNKPFSDRQYDLVFSGTLSEHKNPFFIIGILKELKAKKPDVSIVILGKGPLKGQLEKELSDLKVTYKFAGHVEQSEIPNYMGNSRVHIFPTLQEAWGIVVNEAAAAGTPCICSRFTAVAGEIVIDNETGWVLELDVKLWASKIWEILDDSNKWLKFSNQISEKISTYTFKNAAHGMYLASKKATE